MPRSSTFALACGLLLAGSALLAATSASAQSADEKAKAQAEIWKNEQAVYYGRADGTMSTYEQATHPDYMAWPPWSPGPFRADGLKKTQATLGGKAEKLTMEFKDFTMSGDTALIYYQTHRTMLGDGTPVDQIYENIHVWKKDGGVWKVMGGMAREKAKPKPK